MKIKPACEFEIRNVHACLWFNILFLHYIYFSLLFFVGYLFERLWLYRVVVFAHVSHIHWKNYSFPKTRHTRHQINAIDPGWQSILIHFTFFTLFFFQCRIFFLGAIHCTTYPSISRLKYGWFWASIRYFSDSVSLLDWYKTVCASKWSTRINVL